MKVTKKEAFAKNRYLRMQTITQINEDDVINSEKL